MFGTYIEISLLVRYGLLLKTIWEILQKSACLLVQYFCEILVLVKKFVTRLEINLNFELFATLFL